VDLHGKATRHITIGLVKPTCTSDDDARQLIDYRYCKENHCGDVFFFSAEAVRRFPEFCRMDVFDFDKTAWIPKGVVEVAL
jgi:hypothetical protein